MTVSLRALTREVGVQKATKLIDAAAREGWTAPSAADAGAATAGADAAGAVAAGDAAAGPVYLPSSDSPHLF